MEEIDADAPLDWVTFQILPENRYDFYISSGGKEEKVGSGSLDQLVEHLIKIKDLHNTGSQDTFKLDLPKTHDHTKWFTKATLMRFFHIIGSEEILKKTIAINKEMSQLEETRRFHVSLYSKGDEDDMTNEAADDCGPNLKSRKLAEDGVLSSDDSKNELLRAMDSRLTALREELITAFRLAAGATCSLPEIMDLKRFCEHFEIVDIRDLFSKLLELGQQFGDVETQDAVERPVICNLRSDNVNQTDGSAQISGPSHSVTPVKYSASPAKAAEIERQSSTESEDSSCSSEEDKPSAERSRTVIRSASPRRSASPMRRVQIGRSGSRRAPALTIKNLNCFPARERTSTYRDSPTTDCEPEEPGKFNKKTEVNVTRMSVQDAISLFESKQRDQTSDTQMRRSLVDNSGNTNRSILRRWSAGMGESSPKSLTASTSEHMAPVGDFQMDEDVSKSTTEVKPDAEPASGYKESVETAEADLDMESNDRIASETNQDDVTISQSEHTSERWDSVEWNRKKEAELNQMLMKFAKTNQIKYQNTEPGKTEIQISALEKKGRIHDSYKGKKDEKLQGDNTKRVEKQAQFRVMQKILDRTKAETTTTKVSDVAKKTSANKTARPIKNTPQSSNSKKESSKSAAPKKASSRSSPLPATRKSWPSTPSPRVTGASPTKISSRISSGSTAPSQKSQSPSLPRKSQSPAPLSRLNPKTERSEQKQKELKKTPVDTKKNLKNLDDGSTKKSTRTSDQSKTKKSLKSSEEKRKKKSLHSVDESKPQVGLRSGKPTKTEVLTASEDSAAMSPAKAGVRRKVVKKSTVVPVESKPSLRKGSRINTGSDHSAPSTKLSPQVDEPSSKAGDPDPVQEDNHATVSDLTSQQVERDLEQPDNHDADLDPEVQGEMHPNGAEDVSSVELPIQSDETVESKAESPAEIQPAEEPTISPATWVDNGQQDLPIPSNNNDTQVASPANPATMAASGTRVRHSLSQMLLEESSEPDIIEWGNAENPPAMIYQKDAPRGLKRLLKFGRKTRGEANIADWSSVCTSEGEDDGDECKSLGKRGSENLLRKVALHAKNYGQQGASSSDGVDKNLTDSEPLSARLNASNSSTKASRSFFSLSAFRGNKATETKLR